MHWRHTVLAGLGLAVIVSLAMLLEWFWGQKLPEPPPPRLTGPQSCVVVIGDPANTSPVLDISSLTTAPVCPFQQRYFVQMQGVEVWSDAGAVQIEAYALLAGRQFRLPPSDVFFAADGFGIRGIAIRGMPRYVHIIFRFTVHADEAHHGPVKGTDVRLFWSLPPQRPEPAARVVVQVLDGVPDRRQLVASVLAGMGGQYSKRLRT